MKSTREREVDRLADEISELASHIAAATARWLALLGRFDAEQGFGDGYKTTAHWLSWRCGMTISTAREHVRVAQRLRERPLIQEAFESGELSYSKVRALMRLDEDFDEQMMLDYARFASASQLETIVRAAQRCGLVEEAARQQAERNFTWAYDDEGCVVFRGRLPAEQGAVVIRALEAARDALGPPPAEAGEGLANWQAQDAVSHAARRADAFVAVAQSALAERAGSADVYQVVVHVDADALNPASAADQSETVGLRCHLEDGEPLSSEAIRRLTCDASIVTALERDGSPLAVGRKTRTISPSLRRALQMRDRGCAFPGCTQRHHVDAHHVKHWADGGTTDPENCLQLCRFHHTLVHRGLFEVRRKGKTFAWFRSDGTSIQQAPRQPRGDCANVIHAPGRDRRTSGSLYPLEATATGARLDWAVEAMLEGRKAGDARTAEAVLG